MGRVSPSYGPAARPAARLQSPCEFSSHLGRVSGPPPTSLGSLPLRIAVPSAASLLPGRSHLATKSRGRSDRDVRPVLCVLHSSFQPIPPSCLCRRPAPPLPSVQSGRSWFGSLATPASLDAGHRVSYRHDEENERAVIAETHDAAWWRHLKNG